MITLLAFVFVLGVLVFVHELGHFLAAKRVGIRVLKFQLGFNPTIVSFRRGDTEYSIGALPLGGYVKMAGENPEDVERDEHGNRSSTRTSSCEDEVAAVPGPDHGTDHEPAARRRPDRGGALPGRREGRLRRPAGRRRRRRPRIGGGEGRHPARRSRSCRSAATTSTPGISSSIAVGIEAEPRDRRSACSATACEQTRTVTPTRGRPEPVRDRRHRRAAERPPACRRRSRRTSAARTRRPQGRTTSSLAVDGKPITFSWQLQRGDRQASRAADRDVDPARRRRRMTFTATPARHGDDGLLGIRIGDDTISVKPGFGEAIS